MSEPSRLIAHTTEPMRHPWPEGMLVQGGSRGVVLATDGAYRTAFVEAFPEGTFLRGEGATIAEAEDACWAQYQVHASCEHGPFERRHYINGSGFCTKCGTWMSSVFEPLPEPEDRQPSVLERALLGELGGLQEVADALATAKPRPGSPGDADRD